MSVESIPWYWYGLGFFGQLLFSCRFLIQWIASERRKASVVPDLFWWFSIGGGLCLLTYASFKQDPVFIVGQSAGLIVYVRNIVLVRRSRAAAAE